ncbi:DNAse [Stutzerimonas xanthomarina]|jgi:endonuclease/exonuclease/phosphatase family metal-dependent hydrolase|uniref:DNAse n=1 Tax=Stutzerimonas xanthomarina TaxID=271420 RepID=A0A3R8TW36_9GAMM|nr:DNAse [Stutzerimonas xanthomarina]
MVRGFAAATVLVIAGLFQSVAVAADIRLGTWNLMRLGQGETSYEAIAAIAATVDLLAIQEVMNQTGIERVETAVEARTGEAWSVIVSSPVGSTRYRETYAFLTRDSAVTYDEGAVLYLDRKNVFIREPFSAKFRTAAGATFAIANVHILYGKRESDRIPEIAELAAYWAWLKEVYPGEELLLAGDFNMPPSHAGFAPLRRYARPLVTSGASTLSHTSGKFANLFDNIFVAQDSKLTITAAGVVNYPSMLGLSHSQARAYVSDHAPIFVQLGRGRLPPGVQLIPQQKVVRVGAPIERTQPANDSRSGASRSPAPVHANRSSGIYHLPQGCPSYGRVSARNLEVFASEEEAVAARYRRAGNCR